MFVEMPYAKQNVIITELFMWFPIAQIMLDLEATPFLIFIWRVQMQSL